MRFECRIDRVSDGWTVSHNSKDVGQVDVRAATREEAIEKIVGEIRYRLELCPCTAETYQHVDVQIIESK